MIKPQLQPVAVVENKAYSIFLLQGLSNPFLAARYHSLVIAKDSVPEDLEVTAWTDDGTIMAVQHRKYPQIQVSHASNMQIAQQSVLSQKHCERLLGRLQVTQYAEHLFMLQVLSRGVKHLLLSNINRILGHKV